MYYKKIKIKGYKLLGMYPVYCDTMYEGREPLKIVGIREDKVELQGDFSGGTHGVTQSGWFNDDECFIIQTVCPEMLRPNGCQIHNVNCCGGGDIIKKHEDKYWENLK